MKYIYYSIIAILFIALAWVYFTKPEPVNGTRTVTDTNTVTVYLAEAKKQTEPPKLLEKPFVKQSKPEEIRQQPIDTTFLERIVKHDLILGLDKQGTKLRVFAVNEYGMLLKEQLFENVYSNFTAYSAESAVIVKSSLWYWNGLKLGYTQLRPVNSIRNFTHSVDLMTGFNFIEKYSLDAGLEYDFKNVNLKAKVTWRVF